MKTIVFLMINIYKRIVYKADFITIKDSHIYYSASDGEFKSRYNNHTNLFRHWRHE